MEQLDTELQKGIDKVIKALADFIYRPTEILIKENHVWFLSAPLSFTMTVDDLKSDQIYHKLLREMSLKMNGDLIMATSPELTNDYRYFP